MESDLIWNVIEHSPLAYPHNADRTITSRVNLVNLGTAQILTIPGEAMPNIGDVTVTRTPVNLGGNSGGFSWLARRCRAGIL